MDVSDVWEGPGWWLASDGRWYAPHLNANPEVVPAIRGATHYQLPTPTASRPAPAPAPAPSTPGVVLVPADITLSRSRPPRQATALRHLTRPTLGGPLAFVLVVAGGVGGFFLFHTEAGRQTAETSTAPPPGATTTTVAAPAHAASAPPTTTATAPSSGPAGLAGSIGLQAGDLPGWSVAGPGSVQATPQEPGPCNPVSSAPFTADVTSSSYGSPGGWTAFSSVVVMPDASRAKAALAAISSTRYATSCFETTWDAWAEDDLAQVNAETPCQLTFGGSSIVSLTVLESVSKLAPGANGFEYQADITCPSEGTEPLVRDEISAVVGNVFIQGQFFGLGTPPTETEPVVMMQMVLRARGALGQGP